MVSPVPFRHGRACPWLVPAIHVVKPQPDVGEKSRFRGSFLTIGAAATWTAGKSPAMMGGRGSSTVYDRARRATEVRHGNHAFRQDGHEGFKTVPRLHDLW